MAQNTKPIPIDLKQGGDDLDDDFVIDDTVALSADEADGPGAQLDDEDLFDVGGDDDARNGEDDDVEDNTTSPTDAAIAKKRKRREKEKAHKAKVKSS
jgi:protein CMS1